MTAAARLHNALTSRARYGPRRAALGLVLLSGLGVFAGGLLGDPAPASGEAGGSPAGTGTSPAATTAPSCPSSNPPNQMTLVAGTPQTATVQSAFATGLQVTLANSDGCPVTGAAGVPVTFSTPASGASGTFSASNSNTVTVGADASGVVSAPTFTANDIAGSYTLLASSQYGSLSFSLTNTAAGIPASLTPIAPTSGSTSVTGRYPQPLQVEVADADGNPVAGATVAFTLGSAGTSACGASTAASASFSGGSTQATATTNAAGVASSPGLTANGSAGSFTATATISSSSAGAAAAEGRSGASNVRPVSFSLVNLAGAPAKITPGVGSTQSTRIGAQFPIRLAVTVTDAEKNPIAGAPITFSAPAAGASGRFTARSLGSSHHRSRISHPHTIMVKTNGCGIAIAPVLTANRRPGGYIVKASVKHSRPAAFALVNEAPGQKP